MPAPASSTPAPCTRPSASAGSAPFLPPMTKATSRPSVPSSASGVAAGSASTAPRKEAKLPGGAREQVGRVHVGEQVSSHVSTGGLPHLLRPHV